MKPLEGRITALERARKKPLPFYSFTLEGGAEVFLDALDAHLYLARMKAGKVQRIRKAEQTSGTFPKAGTVWLDLQSEISNITLTRKGV
jgi:hypothetical protein